MFHKLLLGGAAQTQPGRGGEPSSCRGHAAVYTIVRGPLNIISLKLSLLDLVKHFINPPLMPWQGQTKFVLGPSMPAGQMCPPLA